MGTFPREDARQELGVTPSVGVRARIDTRTGAGAVGRAVAGAGLAIIGEVRERSENERIAEEKRQKFLDTNAAIDITSLTKAAVNNNIDFRKANANTELWEQNLKEEFGKVESQIAGFNMSDDARTLATTRFDADSLEAFGLLSIAQTGQEANNTREKVVLDITSAVRSGTPQDRADAVARFRDVRGDVWPNASVAKDIFESAVEAGNKGRKQDVIDSWQDRIAENPTQTKVLLEAELAARKGAGFDPGGSGFDIVTSEQSGAVPDEAGHLGSLDPRTGMLLKGINHKTIEKTFATEKKLGNKIIFRDNRFFSVPQDATGDALTLSEAQKIKTKPTQGGTIPENELPSSDIQSLINLANARQVQLLADTLAERNRQQSDEENELYDGLADKTKSIPDITRSNLDAAAKRRLVNDEENFAQRDVNKTWPLADNDVIVQRLDSQLSSLEAGTIDRTQMNQQINTAAVNGQLTEETRDKFRALAKKGGRDAVDAAVAFEVDKIENALIRRFTERESRFLLRSLERPLTSQESREASSNAYLLQINRHQLSLIEGEIERNMRPPITDKDVISGIEATAIAAKVWEKYRTKTLGEKINDFKEFRGQRVPKPDGFRQEVWEDVNDRERADIIEAVSNGMSNADILKMIGR